MTAGGAPLAALAALADNPVPPQVEGGFIGLLGDRASHYSRSPAIWQAALARLGLRAAYHPLDVPPERLAAVVDAMRATPTCWGANVTVPHKEAVVPFLDALEPSAEATGAVNTVVRRPDGRLVGANTDVVGAVAGLLRPERDAPLLDSLYGRTVLVIGAGGAARALVAALGGLLGTGELLVTNRSMDRARTVAALASSLGGRARTVGEDALDGALGAVDVVINASLRGQAGLRRRDGGWTTLEPYSALAPADPAVVPGPEETAYDRAVEAAAAGIAANHARSRERLARLRRDAVVLDLVYAPPATVLLRQAAAAGLRAVNGRWMMIAQAAEACVAHICRPRLGDVDAEAARVAVMDAMAAAWPPE